MRCVNCGNLNSLGSYDLRKATSRPSERNRDYFNLFDLLKVAWEIIQVKAEENGHGPSSVRYGKIDRLAVYILKRTENFVIGKVTKLIEKLDASVSIAFFAFSLSSRS